MESSIFSCRRWYTVAVILIVLLSIDVAQSTEISIAENLNNEGIDLANQGNYTTAILMFDSAIVLDPNNATFWNNKGLAYSHLGNYAEAILCYDEAIRLDPKDTNAIGNRAEAVGYNGVSPLATHSSPWASISESLGVIQFFLILVIIVVIIVVAIIVGPSPHGYPPFGEARQVFISHENSDKKQADAIKKQLQLDGISTWMYEYDSIAGIFYVIQTRRAIRRCCVFVLLISEASVKSNQVNIEVICAHEHERYIFPVLIDIDFEKFIRVRGEWHTLCGGRVAQVMLEHEEDIASSIRDLINICQ